MIPQKLVICGWGPYKNRIEVDFTAFENRGIFLITGATGAGKTTIFDAISYALYGALSGETRDKDRNSVRSDFAEAETPTYVKLEMTHAGKTYRIHRNPEYMRPKKRSGGESAYTKEKENAILYLPEEKVIEGVKEVNTYMRSLLALDFSQFKQLSMIAQGEFARLLTASPKDKTKIFREIFGTGIYERFTANLSARAKKYYILIAEQKNKLEEDLRLLATGLADVELEEAKKEELLTLINAQYVNYEQLELCLKEVQTEAEAMRGWQEKAFRSAEKSLEELNASVVQKKEENKRILEYRSALAAGEELENQREQYVQKSAIYQKAVNAGWVERAEFRRKQAEGRLQSLLEEMNALSEEIGTKKETIEQLMPFWEKRDVIKQLIQDMEELEIRIKNSKALEKVLKQKSEELDAGRMLYLKKEESGLVAKNAYEEALRLQKHAAIGLAASLLEKGKPCPVCGSLEHPQPAMVAADLLSEEEIEKLKELYESKEADTKACHAQVIMLQTQVQEYQRNLQAEQEKVAVLEEKLELVTEPLFVAFVEKSAKEASEQWQKKCDAMQKLQTVLQEKEKRLMILGEKKDTFEAEVRDAQKEFLEVLQQFGFANEQEYLEAFLDKNDRDALGKNLEQYQNRVTANKELVQHLSLAVGENTLVDITELENNLERQRQVKEKALKSLRMWEQFLREVKKTYTLFCEKVEKIKEQSKEYGYIKELENIASGNNSKKLVFEQYVLAGYFEEILKAANIRFRKMTSGRYEMHRTQEVGDGRVKDNMEIEVMDYYTGKYRSVRTLSGGESFKASLSLALGLSDVIQAMNGGIKVDTLFIDEGFGALDSESLDQACETLMGLVESQRLIGIISHVQELRERIDKQIVIDKTGSGSTLKVVVN